MENGRWMMDGENRELTDEKQKAHDGNRRSEVSLFPPRLRYGGKVPGSLLSDGRKQEINFL